VAELTAAEELSLFSSVVGQSRDAVLIADAETLRLINVNETACRMLGRGRDELLKCTLAEIDPKMVEPAFARSFKEALERDGAIVFRSTAAGEDGSRISVEISSTIAFHEGKKYLVSIGRDISEVTRTQEELRRSEEKYRDLIENSRDIAFSVNAAGAITFLGPQAMRYGVDPEEAVSRDFLDLVAPEDKERVAADFRLALTTGKEFPTEFRIVDSEGNVHWFEEQGAILRDASGEITRFSGTLLDITKRKCAEEALRQSEGHLAESQRIAHFGHWRLDVAAGVISGSEEFFRIFGIPREEGSLDAFVEVVHPDDRERDLRHIKRGMEHGESWDIEHRLICRDGTEKSVRVIGEVITDDAGSVVTLVGTVQDITERKQAELQLRLGQDRAQRYLDLAGVVFVAINTDGTVALVNKKGCEILGYSEDEIVGRDWISNFVPKRLRNDVAPVAEELLRGEVEGAEYHVNPVLTAGGEERLIAWHNTVLRDDDGTVTGTLSSGEDITERRRSEQAMQALVRASAGSVGKEFFADVVTSMCEWLDVDCAIIGEITDEDRVNALSMRLDGEFVEHYSYGLAGTPCGRSAREGYCVYSDKVGMLFPDDEDLVSMGAEGYVGILLRGRSGDAIGLLCAISRRKMSLPPQVREVMEIIAARAVAEIERKRAEEEKENLEEQLRHTQKMEAIGTLAGGIAHDFNNLLQGILGYADLLKMRSTDGDMINRAADVIERAGTRAAELTRQLLGFARKGKLRDMPVDFHRIIGETVAILARTIDKRITMIQTLNAEPCVVKGDPGQLQQVVMNLAVNARDVIQGGGELTFETSVVDHKDGCRELPGDLLPGKYLLLSVTDTGAGMTPNVLERIFEPFFTTKPQGEGTGMGLAMVYGIVKNHGGAVKARSGQGKGTTFDIYLPIAEKAARITDTQKLKLVQRGSGHILVVDDEETVREVVTEILESLGYDVTCASDGREAVERYREKASEIDLVLLDMTMPVMDGPECFEELKKINPGVKVVVATGHALDGATQETIDAGALRSIHKPFIMADLAATVAKALSV
jgi:PAS domain S-box-containing protein